VLEDQSVNHDEHSINQNANANANAINFQHRPLRWHASKNLDIQDQHQPLQWRANVTSFATGAERQRVCHSAAQGSMSIQTCGFDAAMPQNIDGVVQQSFQNQNRVPECRSYAQLVGVVSGRAQPRSECAGRILEHLSMFALSSEIRTAARIPQNLCLSIEDTGSLQSINLSIDVELDSIPTSSNTESTVYWKNGERHQIRPWQPHLSDQLASLPLADVAPPGFKYNKLEEWFAQVVPPDNLKMMIQWLSTPELARRLATHKITMEHDNITRNPKFDITPLINRNTIEKLRGKETNALSARVFTVPKSDHVTARFILDGRNFDKVFQAVVGKPPIMPLPQIPQVVDTILNGWNIISSSDAKSMFYQFPLHYELRRYFGFDIAYNDKPATLYRLRALPMGVCFAPTFAQHVSNYICELVKFVTYKEHNNEIELEIFAWVDNFILLTKSKEHDTAVRKIFDRITNSVNLEMKGWIGGEHVLDALGIHFDLKNCTATPTDNMQENVRKLNIALQQQNSKNSSYLNRIYLRWFGTIQWLSYSTARLPLCFCPCVMATMRQICIDESWDGTTTATDELMSEINRISSACLNVAYTPKRQVQNRQMTRIWSDASTKMIAAIHEQQLVAFTESISCTNRQICIAELTAGYCGYQLFDVADIWVTDNLAAAHAFARGHSGSKECDELLRTWLNTKRTPRIVLWVDTACQIADPLTRPDQRYEPKPCTAQHMTFYVRWREEGVGALFSSTSVITAQTTLLL
jgi:hypothetical protein